MPKDREKNLLCSRWRWKYIGKIDSTLMAIKASGFRLSQITKQEGYVIVDYSKIKITLITLIHLLQVMILKRKRRCCDKKYCLVTEKMYWDLQLRWDFILYLTSMLYILTLYMQTYWHVHTKAKKCSKNFKWRRFQYYLDTLH